MRTWVLAATMVVTAQGALAADMPDLPVLRGFMNDGPRTTHTVWEGAYVGGQAGYTSSQMNFTGTNNSLSSSFLTNNSVLFQNSPVGLPAFPVLGRSWSQSTGLGGFVGYNAQWDDAVISVEGSYTHLNLTGSFVGATQFSTVAQAGGYAYQAFTDSRASLAVHDLGTLRVRGGYAAGAFMPYAFAGLALARGDISRVVTARVDRTPIVGQVQDVNAGLGIAPVTGTDDITNRLLYGYTFGVGSEVLLFGNIFARAEYEYVRLTTPVDININSVRGGLGYKF
jgi:outer membrane immunogenic protein